jgi:hypothetical protein
VLDSISSADYAARLQSRAGRIHCLVYRGAAARLHQGDRERVARKLGPISINVRLTAVRRLAVEAADNVAIAI